MDGFWITEALRGVRTLKGDSVISGFQWVQWFGGRAFETRTKGSERHERGVSCFVAFVVFVGFVFPVDVGPLSIAASHWPHPSNRPPSPS